MIEKEKFKKEEENLELREQNETLKLQLHQLRKLCGADRKSEKASRGLTQRQTVISEKRVFRKQTQDGPFFLVPDKSQLLWEKELDLKEIEKQLSRDS